MNSFRVQMSSNSLHVNENKAYWLLHKLVKDNVIVPVNRGRYAKYQLKRS